MPASLALGQIPVMLQLRGPAHFRPGKGTLKFHYRSLRPQSPAGIRDKCGAPFACSQILHHSIDLLCVLLPFAPIMGRQLAGSEKGPKRGQSN